MDPELFHQRRAQEHQGNNTRLFISYFSSPYTGHFGHSGAPKVRIPLLTLVRLRQRRLRTPLPGIFLSNVRSLPNKLEELQLLLGKNRDFPSSAVLCFTETWLSGLIPDSALHLAGFQLCRADRDTELSGKTKGGGICFYINSGWCNDVTVIQQHCSPDLESFIINCKPFYSPREFASFILVGVYIPPQANVQDAQRMLADQILCVERSNPDYLVIVLGDFNKGNLTHNLTKIQTGY